MWINYIKIALRKLSKHKGLSFINIFGLSLGFACFVMFLLYALHEFSFDRFHKDSDQIYRVYRWSEDLDGEGTEGDTHLPMPLGPSLMADFPDVEQIVRWKEAWGENFARIGQKVVRVELAHIDHSAFEVFNFPILIGDPNTALKDPSNIVLTESMAVNLFGSTDVIDETIEIKISDVYETFRISAVLEDMPTNSSLQFQLAGSFDYFAASEFGIRRENNWYSSFLPLFVKLRPGSRLFEDNQSLLDFRRKYYPDEEEELRADGRWTGEGAPVTYRMQPIRDMHVNTAIGSADVPAVDPQNIWTLLMIAGGILFIAIINFTTLSIGRSADRAREVGIRKAIGSSRQTLVGLFLTEALLMSTISVLIGLGLCHMLLPAFNHLSGRELVLSFSRFPALLPWLIGATAVVGLLAGSYPAFVLSKFKTTDVIKNKIRLGGSNWFTKSLVTVQFVVSCGLVISTIVILNQLNFMKSKSPGFEKENVIIVDAEETESEAIYPRFKEAIRSHPDILGVASAELSLGAGMGWSRSGFDYKGENKQVFEYFVDDDYLNVMGIDVLRGRGFEPTREDGPNLSVIINEKMMTDFGWTIEDAVGQELSGYSNEGPNPKVIGVVKDFHFRPFSELVRPQMFHQFVDYAPFKYLVRVRPGPPDRVLDHMEKSWSSIAEEYPFKYSFLDDDINRFYRSEERFSQIVAWAGGISIFLACMGLMGLAALSAANRTKEIGIRKVLGATITSIVSMLTKDFLMLVLAAMLIACPLVWVLMSRWLANFAYRVQLEWWMFAMAGVFSVFVAILTVSYQCIRAALANPVDSFRSE